jgi:hypothetical protein
MTLKQTGMSVEQVMSVRDRSLEDSYELHDLGMERLEAKLEAHGLHVVEHGDDARHAETVLYGDGPDVAVYTLREDVRYNADGLGSEYIDARTGQFVSPDDAYELLCYIELKTKDDPEWFGRCNLRHYREYVEHVAETEVPTYIYFALIDEETCICHREAFVEVRDTDQISGDLVDVQTTDLVVYEQDVHDISGSEELCVVDGSDVVNVDRDEIITEFIPGVHGNDVIELDHREFRTLEHVLHETGYTE